ncbi:MAG TPA: MerR family transcriptional regulator [Chitinophagaceae bacterium]|nr:MerR family transcriptional regulator [Chitinophagaceae bacterium]
MTKFTIKDLENLSGIKAHTIRIWEQRYSFLKPSRTDTNIRYYSNDDLKAILNISILNKYGYKISHINKMSVSDVQARVAELNIAGAPQERIVNELIQLMVDLDTAGLERLIDKQIAAAGIEKTIIRIIFPFFERIGILWQTGHINPAQEHLITNIIRQKLIVGIDQAKSLLKVKRSFLLFLPEGEHHELGLLLVYYLLKRKGAEVFYIGANVPLKDAQFVAEIKKPDFVYIHLTSTSSGFNFQKFLTQTSGKIPGSKIIVSGHVTHDYKKALPKNVEFKHSLVELVEFISAL